jgi:hypothetical protein
MRIALLTSLAALFLAVALPVFAAEPMTMKKGESVLIEPDGTATMLPAMTGTMDPGMKAAAKPLDKCLILMMGDDGKMYMSEDMAMADGKMACATLKTMAK